MDGRTMTLYLYIYIHFFIIDIKDTCAKKILTSSICACYGDCFDVIIKQKGMFRLNARGFWVRKICFRNFHTFGNVKIIF